MNSASIPQDNLSPETDIYDCYSRDAYNRLLLERQAKRAKKYPIRTAQQKNTPGARLVRVAKRYPNAIVLLIMAVLLAIVGFSLLPSPNSFPQDNSAQLGQADLTAATNGTSTPRDSWKRDTIPLLLQTDSEWAAVPYADGTIQTHGCGPTCLSMVYVALTGKKDRDPADMAKFSESEGYIDSGITSWLLMSDGAQKLGLKSREVSADIGNVTAELSAGRPIICSVGPGDFTTSGHFIVLAGVDESGNLIVRDPNSAERSAQAWNAQKVLAQCRNIWSFYV